MAAVRGAINDLADSDPAKRVTAAKTLGSHFPEGALAVPLLEVTLRDDSKQVRGAAEQALRRLADKALPSFVAFLRDAEHPQNTALLEARAVLMKLGARVTPYDLNKVDGRASRAVRLCCSPPQRDPTPTQYLAFLYRELLASDAGLLSLGSFKNQLDDESRIVCAAMALHGARSLASAPSGALRNAVHDLLSDKAELCRWAGVRLAEVFEIDSPEAQEALRKNKARRWKPDDVKTLLAELPDPTASLRKLEIEAFAITFAAQKLAAYGEEAAPALPTLRALYERLKGSTEARHLRCEVALAGAICQIGRPADPWLKCLLDAATLDESEDYGSMGAAGMATVVLAGCRWEGAPKVVKSEVARAAAALLGTGGNDTDGDALLANGRRGMEAAAVVLLERLGTAAHPAQGAVAKTLGEFLAVVSAAGKAHRKPGDARESPGQANALFVKDTLYYPGNLAGLYWAIRVLGNLDSLDTSTKAVLLEIKRGKNPLLACEAAAALRR